MPSLQDRISGHLAQLVDIATSSVGWTVNNAVGDVVTRMAKDLDIHVWALGELAGTVGKHAIVISRPGGSRSRISIAMQDLDQKTPALFVAGCFKGTSEELGQLSLEKHKPGTEENLHYANFRKVAGFLLMHLDELRPLATVIREEVELSHSTREMRAAGQRKTEALPA